MKRSHVIILLWLITMVAIVVLWMIAPAQTAAPAAKAPGSQPRVPKAAVAGPLESGSPAKARVGLPKSASSAPTDESIPLMFGKPLTATNIAAMREEHRRGLEQQILDVQREQQKLMDNAATPEEREMQQKKMEELVQRYQWRLEELAGPPPDPQDFGDVALVDGVTIEKTLLNGIVVSLTPKIRPDGQWRIKIVEHIGGPYVVEGVMEVPVTPGQRMAVSGEGDEQFYFFTPRINAGAATAAGKSTTAPTTPAQ